MKKQNIFAIIAAFCLLVIPLNASEYEADVALVEYGKYLREKYESLEIERDKIGSLMLKEGDVLTVDITLDEGVQFVFFASGDKTARGLELSLFDSSGDEVPVSDEFVESEEGDDDGAFGLYSGSEIDSSDSSDKDEDEDEDEENEGGSNENEGVEEESSTEEEKPFGEHIFVTPQYTDVYTINVKLTSLKEGENEAWLAVSFGSEVSLFGF